MSFSHDIDSPESYRDRKVIYMSRYSVTESLYTYFLAKVTCGNDAFLHMSALCIKDRSKPIG
jgi:choline kinase